jgi:hypothetical protein
MRKFFKSIGVFLSMIFKKSSEGMANSTGLAVAPNLKQETENVVVKKQEDNYFQQTMGKSYRQHQYEQTVKKQGIIENPYLDWEKAKPDYHKHPLTDNQITEEEWKSTLKDKK